MPQIEVNEDLVEVLPESNKVGAEQSVLYAPYVDGVRSGVRAEPPVRGRQDAADFKVGKRERDEHHEQQHDEGLTEPPQDVVEHRQSLTAPFGPARFANPPD